MARAKKHDKSVICFDMNMEPPAKANAEKALDFLLQTKKLIPGNKNDEMTFLIFNTENNESTQLIDMYMPHFEFVSYSVFDRDALQDKIPKVTNWFTAIKLALNLLCKQADAKELCTLQLIIFTDLSTSLDPVMIDSEQVDALIQKLLKYNVYLYILGPEVVEPHYISSIDDIQSWSRNIEFKDKTGCEFTKEIIGKIVREVSGIMCEPFLGVEFIDSYRCWKGRQEWKVPLEIGSGTLLEVTTSRCLDLFSTPKISQRVRANYKYMLKDKEISEDETILAFRQDQKIIVIPKDVRDNYIKDYVGERMFKLFAFVPIASIPEIYLFGGEAHCVDIPADSVDAHALHTLITTLHRLGRCGLAWRVYNKNNCPKLYAAMARIEPTCHLYLVPLANAHEVQMPFRDGDVDKLAKGDASSDYYKSVTGYLDLLRDPQRKPPLHPTYSTGPWLSCFLQRLNHINGRNSSKPDSVDPTLPQLDLGRSKLGENAKNLEEVIKTYLKQKKEDEEVPELKMEDGVDNNDDDEW